MPPKLDRPRAKVTSLLVDRGTITRNEDGTTDAPVDRATGRIIDDEPNTFYGPDIEPHRGAMLVTPLRFQDRGDGVVQLAKGLLPWDAPVPKVGDVLQLTVSADPQLIDGPPFVVDDVEGSSYLVARKIVLARVLPGQPGL